MSKKLRVLIGYDGSECSASAINDLRRAGLPSDTEAIVFSVSDVWEEPGAFDQLTHYSEVPSVEEMTSIRMYIAAARKEVEALAEKGSELVKANFSGWEVHSESRSGNPAWEIIERSDVWKADLIVVGSQGRTALGRAILGSVSHKVLREANCSVRIAREPVSEAGSPSRILIAVDGSEYAEEAVRAAARRHGIQDHHGGR
jgi:nucleotide-binding universal stress UspA family protein